jgi:hypothetical protein
MCFDIVVQLADVWRGLKHMNNVSVIRLWIDDKFAIVQGGVQVGA